MPPRQAPPTGHHWQSAGTAPVCLVSLKMGGRVGGREGGKKKESDMRRANTVVQLGRERGKEQGKGGRE